MFTFNTRKNAEISLKNVNLLHYFTLIVGRDNIANLKPHPDHLNHICKELNVKTNELLVIGDNVRDIEAAINVGAHSIAMQSKLAKIETLKNADKIIKENEIPLKLIEEIGKLL
ncbi:MAG: HAD family hydrolase [Promethearchaeota archaeon]